MHHRGPDNYGQNENGLGENRLQVLLFIADIIRALRKTASHSAVIILSKSPLASDVIEAFHLGVDDFLIKPVNPETLSWAIRRANSNHQNSGKECFKK